MGSRLQGGGQWPCGGNTDERERSHAREGTREQEYGTGHKQTIDQLR